MLEVFRVSKSSPHPLWRVMESTLVAKTPFVSLSEHLPQGLVEMAHMTSSSRCRSSASNLSAQTRRYGSSQLSRLDQGLESDPVHPTLGIGPYIDEAGGAQDA